MMEFETALRIFLTGIALLFASFIAGIYTVGNEKLDRAFRAACIISSAVISIGIICMIWSY